MNYIEMKLGWGDCFPGPYETGVEYRAPQDVLERVLESNTATAAPLHCQHEPNGPETTETYSCPIMVSNTIDAEPLPLHQKTQRSKNHHSKANILQFCLPNMLVFTNKMLPENTTKSKTS